MLDFLIAAKTTIPVGIGGVEYNLPRFLLSAFKEKAAADRKAMIDEALAPLGNDKDAKARFLIWNPPPPIDVAMMTRRLMTPAGVEYVVRYCCGKGGVPAETITALLECTPTPFLRDLCGILTGIEMAPDAIEKDSGEPAPLKDGASPLTEGGTQTSAPPPTSGDVPTTGESTSPSTPLPTTTTPTT